MESNLQKIEHVVVLMLENRSFDNMLGFLGASEGTGQKVNGVANKQLSNPIPDYVPHREEQEEVPVGIETKMTNPNPDPGEEYAHVNTQLFGHIIPEGNRDKPFDKKPAEPYNLPEQESYTNAPMNGFVIDYINHFHALVGRMPDYEEYKVIMNCFAEESVPVLSTLAKEFAVFDMWFASVPSQTLCNRSFVHTGTSHGYVLNMPFYHWLWHDTPTIFNRIEEKRDPVLTWKIYYDKLDIVSSTGLQHRALWKYRKTNFFHMDDFESDAAQGTLPSYAFVEPRFFIDHNDQHPPLGDVLETSSVLAGELLINRVYNALRNGKHWDRTLLIITYDEHGGCYDHVSPPAAIPPEPGAPVGEQGFKFDRLGVRVPTVMVSPYIERGTVISDIHDHTSIIKFLCDRWDLQPLTERDKHASTFKNVLNRSAPRKKEDTPTITPREYKIPRNALDEPVTDLHRAALFLMAGFDDASQFVGDKNLFHKAQDLLQLVVDENRIAHIKTVGQAIHFAIGFDRRVTRHLSFFDWLQVNLKLLFSWI